MNPMFLSVQFRALLSIKIKYLKVFPNYFYPNFLRFSSHFLEVPKTSKLPLFLTLCIHGHLLCVTKLSEVSLSLSFMGVTSNLPVYFIFYSISKYITTHLFKHCHFCLLIFGYVVSTTQNPGP